jgi:hypothetical protein
MKSPITSATAPQLCKKDLGRTLVMHIENKPFGVVVMFVQLD